MKVLEVIDALEEHRKKAENEGNYMEARAAAQRLNGVKVTFNICVITNTLCGKIMVYCTTSVEHISLFLFKLS